MTTKHIIQKQWILYMTYAKLRLFASRNMYNFYKPFIISIKHV